MAEQIFSDEELQFLGCLLFNDVEFMLVGLAAAALQGAPVVTQDIDVWFKNLQNPGIQEALKDVNGAYVPPDGNHPPMFAGKHLQLFDIVTNMDGLADFEEEKNHVVDIDIQGIKIPVLSLTRIIVSKTASNREKDRLVLPVLKDVLKIRESASRENH